MARVRKYTKRPRLSAQAQRAKDAEAFEAARIIAIPLRPNLAIRVANLPFDLTKAEAQRIAGIVLAHGGTS